MTRRHLSRRQLERIRQQHERRRRNAAQRSARHAEALSADGLGVEQSGLVIANYGPTLIVESTDGDLHRCALRQNLGTAVCGDRVTWQPAANTEGVVTAIEQRRSLLTRPNHGGSPRPVAANLDQVAVVFAPRPEPDESLIDRYLVAIETIGIAVLLVMNKIDLLDPQARSALETRFANYRAIGYPLLTASTRSEHGLDELRCRLQHRTSILVGQSGVGKSSLIKALMPDLEIRIQALSEATGLGTHTTTTSMLYHLPDGGDLIDSPGVRSFEPSEIQPAALEHCFVEFRPYLGTCKFSNCSHTVEPECAIREAVQRGEIDARRLASYHGIKGVLR